MICEQPLLNDPGGGVDNALLVVKTKANAIAEVHKTKANATAEVDKVAGEVRVGPVKGL